MLSGLDFAVDAGEIVGIVGANGAGKSTMVATVAGLLVPHRGAIRLDGRRVEGSSPQTMVKRGVCLVPQGRRVFPRLSVRRNLELGGFVHRRGIDVEARAGAFLDRYPRIAARRAVEAGALSGGEQGLVVAVVDHDREALASVTTRTVVVKDGRACNLARA